MAKYRKKPVEIEAIRFEATHKSVLEMYRFINGQESVVLKTAMDHNKFDDYADSIIRGGYDFKTLESNGETQKAVVSDWIIKGVKGEFYPCKPDIFELTYDKVD